MTALPVAQDRVKHANDSADLYFARKPTGKESNRTQTVPGKGWNIILHLSGPLDPFFDKTWRPGDIELVKCTNDVELGRAVANN